MKKFFAVSGWLVAIAALVYSFEVRWEMKKAILLNDLADHRNNLLYDQLQEMEIKVSTNRSYDEGFADAMVRSQSVEYVNGYHAAMNQLSNKSESEEDIEVDLGL